MWPPKFPPCGLIDVVLTLCTLFFRFGFCWMFQSSVLVFNCVVSIKSVLLNLEGYLLLFFFRGQVLDFLGILGSLFLLLCFSVSLLSLLFCFSTFCFSYFSVFLLLCFLLFLLLCFSASPLFLILSFLLLCFFTLFVFPVSLFFCFCFSVFFYFYFSFL